MVLLSEECKESSWNFPGKSFRKRATKFSAVSPRLASLRRSEGHQKVEDRKMRTQKTTKLKSRRNRSGDKMGIPHRESKTQREDHEMQRDNTWNGKYWNHTASESIEVLWWNKWKPHSKWKQMIETAKSLTEFCLPTIALNRKHFLRLYSVGRRDAGPWRRLPIVAHISYFSPEN